MASDQKIISNFEVTLKKLIIKAVLLFKTKNILITYPCKANNTKFMSISLWSINSKIPISSLEAPSNPPNFVYLSPNTKILLTTHQKSYMILWTFHLSQTLNKFNIFYILTKPISRIKANHIYYPVHSLIHYSFQQARTGVISDKKTSDTWNVQVNIKNTPKVSVSFAGIEFYTKAREIEYFRIFTIEKSVAVWNILRNQLVLGYFHEDFVQYAQFSQDLSKEISLSVDIIKVWDLYSCNILYNIINLETVPKMLSLESQFFNTKLKLFEIPQGKYCKLFKLYQKIILQLFKKSSKQLKKKLNLKYLIKLWYPNRSTIFSEPTQPSEHAYQLIKPSKSSKYLAISTKYSVLITKSSLYHKKLSRFSEDINQNPSSISSKPSKTEKINQQSSYLNNP